MGKIISLAPGRTCLFGDHQDYLGLPIIACAINRNIKLEAEENGTRILNINKPDINKKREINIDQKITTIKKGDHLLFTLKVLKKYGCIPNKGYDIEITGNLPINSGTSSSSALVISWINFLITAYGIKNKINAEFISQLAYEAEVVAQAAPGGKMDHYSIGLGNILYLETGNHFSYQIISTPLEGLIIGVSGIPKETIGLLSELKGKALSAIKNIQKYLPDFKVKNAKKADIDKYMDFVPEALQPYFYAAVINHDITQKALIEFKNDQPNFEKIGALMNQHHEILKNVLKITVPRIDAMINAANNAGAYGAKIVGSGGGGSIVVLSPKGKETEIIKNIKEAGGVNAYKVSVDPGARILNKVSI